MVKCSAAAWRRQGGQVAVAVAAEAEILADDQDVHAQGAEQDVADEVAGRAGDHAGEIDEEKAVQRLALQDLQALGVGADQADGVAEENARVGMEGEDHGGQPLARGRRRQGFDDAAVAGVKAVEVADGHGAGAGEPLQAAAESHRRFSARAGERQVVAVQLRLQQHVLLVERPQRRKEGQQQDQDQQRPAGTGSSGRACGRCRAPGPRRASFPGSPGSRSFPFSSSAPC